MEKLIFLQRSKPMVLVQKWSFFQVFFLENICQKNVFYDILERQNAFLGYKNEKSKKSKNWHFCNFSFLGNIGQENVFYHILERKNAFLGFKNKKFKKWKNWHFSKGVNPWFWSKKCHFFNFFFFRKYRPENCLLRYLRAKKRLSRL